MLGAERTRQQVAIRFGRVANTDVAVGVDHVLPGQNPVCDHQIPDRAVQFVHDNTSPTIAQGKLTAPGAGPQGRLKHKAKRLGIAGPLIDA
jgi:hypothetical protein